jgi:2,4-dienoyl-CoA reductase-like NADH-dependent reductase (Old Yellow Enzyme family)
MMAVDTTGKDHAMPSLFEPTTISGMLLTNRFVRSATWEGLATADGASTPALHRMMAELAAGGVGLVIPGYAYVSLEGKDAPGQLGVCADEQTPGLARLALAVHEAGGSIALQLAHAGCFGDPALTAREPLGPSPLETEDGPAGRAMTGDDLAAVTEAFAAAASRARTAGVDAVQVHAAHGYLLSQFLSPYFNRRTDGYGGAVEQRARLLLEVIAAVRAAVGADYPVLVKLNAADFLPGGLSVDDMLRVAGLLEAAGVDAIELSGGTGLLEGLSFSRLGRPRPGEPEAYYEDAARRFKQTVSVPLMLVGGIRTLETAERLVTQGTTDYVALSRPLIREPRLIERWRAGDTAPARCISDNGCFETGDDGKGVFCAVEERRQRLDVTN